ncbi:putative two-component histidine kinase [Oscillibacter valericigenes Sjm18-20]|nr:putative two-component histidine kinase [Oscillibacter valericigenes Sjm18-20]
MVNIEVVIFRTLNSVCGFIAPYVTLVSLEHFLPVRKKRWAKPLLYVGCCLFVGMIIYIGDRANLPGALIPFGLAVFLCCEGDWLQCLSITLIFSSLGLSFNALVDSSFILWDIIHFLRLLLWLGVYLSLRRFAPKQEYNLSPSLWVLIDVLTLTPFAATLITVLLSQNIERISDNIQGFLLLLVVTLSSFGLLWAVVILARQQKLEQEKRFYEMNRLYYRNLEQEQFQVRRLRHDMANHLQTMSGLSEPEMREYLRSLINSPAMEHAQRFCENNVVNVVLASKMAVMEQSKIDADIEVAVPSEIPVQDVDLCALFANGLDNAIEACEKLSEEQRRVSVKTRTDKGLFVMKVQNSHSGKIVWENSMPVTTKKDAGAHGFGLAGIREIAARYGGSVTITEEAGQFVLLVYFPLNENR